MENTNKSEASSREGLLLRMGLNDNKAGMQGLDKEKINKIIMEASKVCLYKLSLMPQLFTVIDCTLSRVHRFNFMTSLFSVNARYLSHYNDVSN